MHYTWTKDDFATAMRCAVESNSKSNLLKCEKGKLLFNGFWRNGDKQNVCVWLDRATWHDAKTGHGGGCKEFASVAFNLSLQEFMARFGQRIEPRERASSPKPKFKPPKNQSLEIPVHKLWQSIIREDQAPSDVASQWLEDIRGFELPRLVIGSGFANLATDCTIFESRHRGFIKDRLGLGPQLVVPIRGVHSNEECNLFFRALSDVSKEDKSRLLPGAGGWSDGDKSPRAFGFPALIHDFPNLVICEGMADYFAAECLLYGEEKYLPLGAPSASALPKWAEWLKDSHYKGRVIWIYQLDVNDEGKILSSETGQLNATKASKILKMAGISSELFQWTSFLKKIPDLKKIPKDLADVYSNCRDSRQIFGEIFLMLYSGNK